MVGRRHSRFCPIPIIAASLSIAVAAVVVRELTQHSIGGGGDAGEEDATHGLMTPLRSEKISSLIGEEGERGESTTDATSSTAYSSEIESRAHDVEHDEVPMTPPPPPPVVADDETEKAANTRGVDGGGEGGGHEDLGTPPPPPPLAVDSDILGDLGE